MLRDYMSERFSYLVGGLLADNLTPERQQEKLNQCGEYGWELIAIKDGIHQGQKYVFFYLKRPEGTGVVDPVKERQIFHFST
jgi:hypothetical protein